MRDWTNQTNGSSNSIRNVVDSLEAPGIHLRVRYPPDDDGRYIHLNRADHRFCTVSCECNASDRNPTAEDSKQRHCGKERLLAR
jgi:hypothetical protein